MDQLFGVLCQNAFKSIFNKQRFFVIFGSLSFFGYTLILFLKVCLQYLGNIPISTLGLSAFFGAYTILCTSSVIVHILLRKEKEGKQVSLLSVFQEKWKALWMSLLVSMPFFMAMIAIGFLLMVMTFLNALPWVGELFHTAFIFVPFVLATASILLFLCSFASLFFCMPVFSQYKDLDYTKLLNGWKGNILTQSLAFIIASAPVVLCMWLALDSFKLMSYLVHVSDVHTWACFIQTLILVTPVALLLTPAVAFFLGFSFGFYESKQVMHTEVKPAAQSSSHSMKDI